MNREKSWFQRPGMPVLQVIEEAMPVKLSDDELLDYAKLRLSSCAFVGVTEYFDESIALLQRTFGWRIPAQVETLNASRQKIPPEEISRECLEKIRELNNLDFQLYEHGNSIFRQRQAFSGNEKDTGGSLSPATNK
jgi:hypothetical protein